MKLQVSYLGSCYSATHPGELSQSLDSIFQAPFCADQVVLVVDGPISYALNVVIRQFEAQYSLDVLRLSRNYGLGLALSEGLSLCKNELIARYDTDDICCPHRLYVQCKFLEANPSVSCVGSDVYEFYEIATSFFFRKKSVPKNAQLLFGNFLIRNPINHPTAMFRRSHVLACGGYEDVAFFEDYHLWIKMLTAGYVLRNIDAPPLVYMRRKSQGLRRTGCSYLLKEIGFAWRILAIDQRLWLLSLCLFVRALLRVSIPLHLVKMPWRERWISTSSAPWILAPPC
jgi:glycosyltransferase involved in cell wall biosynthesis